MFLPHWVTEQLFARSACLQIPSIAAPPIKQKRGKSTAAVEVIERIPIGTQTVEDGSREGRESSLWVCGQRCLNGEVAIQCDYCLRWYHGECVNVDVEIYTVKKEFQCIFGMRMLLMTTVIGMNKWNEWNNFLNNYYNNIFLDSSVRSPLRTINILHYPTTAMNKSKEVNIYMWISHRIEQIMRF